MDDDNLLQVIVPSELYSGGGKKREKKPKDTVCVREAGMLQSWEQGEEGGVGQM